MFEFDPNAHYMMPAHFGPRVGKGSARYGDVTGISVTYLTERDQLAKYLPKPLEVGEEPLVTVSYTMNREIEWLAGGSYNIIGVNCSAVFNGEVDHVVGGFCLVMWENLTDPILTGRELQGIPKIYADIPDHTIFQGEWRTCAAYRGHKIVDIVVKDLEPLTAAELEAISNAPRGAWMGWRYVPNVGAPGAAISHATLFPTTSTPPKEIWKGKGEVIWHHLTWEQNPTQHHIVNALADLPILEYRAAFVTKGGSSNLHVASDPVRALR